MGKKILCLSWCDADNVMNYGQILQALSMMKVLRNYTDEKIEYISYFPRNCKSLIRYYFDHMNINNGHLQAYVRTRRIVKKYTTEFNVNLMQIRKYTQLKKCKNVDIMVCGSDQIWHPCNFDKAFFLDFGCENTKRIAFSVSLPKKSIEQNFIKQYEEMSESLAKVDSIAVREHSSIDLVSKLSNKSIVSVMDPTFLVEKSFWCNLVKPIEIPDKYIFVYIPNGMNSEMVDFVEQIKIELKIPNVLVMLTRGNNLFINSINLGFVDLGQFLYLIKKASLVITSSFHAVVFSSIFHTNFYAYEVKNTTRGEDCRITDILDTLGLEERNIKQNEVDLVRTIDFQAVDERIRIKKNESLAYLNSEIR